MVFWGPRKLDEKQIRRGQKIEFRRRCKTTNMGKLDVNVLFACVNF